MSKVLRLRKTVTVLTVIVPSALRELVSITMYAMMTYIQYLAFFHSNWSMLTKFNPDQVGFRAVVVSP